MHQGQQLFKGRELLALLAVCGAALTALACTQSQVANLPRTEVTVTPIGCVVDSAYRGGRSQLVVNINSQALPDGRMRCTIETVIPYKP